MDYFFLLLLEKNRGKVSIRIFSMSLLARRFTAIRIPSSVRTVRTTSLFKLPETQAIVRRYTSSSPVVPPASDAQGKPQPPRLSLTFTCTVTDCSHRSTHEFSKASYEKGIVLVQCPNCKNRWVAYESGDVWHLRLTLT